MGVINDMNNEHRLALKAKWESLVDELGLTDAKNRDAVAYLIQDAYALGQQSAQARIDRAVEVLETAGNNCNSYCGCTPEDFNYKALKILKGEA